MLWTCITSSAAIAFALARATFGIQKFASRWGGQSRFLRKASWVMWNCETIAYFGILGYFGILIYFGNLMSFRVKRHFGNSWNVVTSCNFRIARIATLQGSTLTSRHIHWRQGDWVDRRICCQCLGLSIGFLQRGIIWIIMVSTAATIARCGIWNKLPTASMCGEGRGGEGVIEGIIATSHACPSMTWAHPPISAVTRSTQP